MPFDAYVVPNDIWFEITIFCGLEEVLSLEATCKFLLKVVSNRSFWLRRLHALDQDHAPDLPRHVPISDLGQTDLRTLVVRAQRHRLNCTGPILRSTRKITVPIWSANLDGALGKPYGFGTDVELLPGGALLLVLWSAGCLQCWSVADGECLWTSADASGMETLKVCSFTYDMQVNGDVHVLVVGESTDSDAHER
ncbi:hypothetical protein DFH11DRAFT_1085908 [Phellopilus nigrolimitatus]|nr:hypothetical protein DFH11DRAFT_1085908 [Phellopilus nigrolimitatus]